MRRSVIADLFDEDLLARGEDFGRPENVPFFAMSEYVELLEYRKQRLKLNRMSLHADLLNQRHAQGELAQIIPLEQFTEADHLLYLRGQLHPAKAPQWVGWRPWSSLYLRQPPRYLQEAVRIKNAQRLLRPLGVDDIPTFRARFTERGHKLRELWSYGIWHYPLERFDAETIGSR